MSVESIERFEMLFMTTTCGITTQAKNLTEKKKHNNIDTTRNCQRDMSLDDYQMSKWNEWMNILSQLIIDGTLFWWVHVILCCVWAFENSISNYFILETFWRKMRLNNIMNKRSATTQWFFYDVSMKESKKAWDRWQERKVCTYVRPLSIKSTISSPAICYLPFGFLSFFRLKLSFDSNEMRNSTILITCFHRFQWIFNGE